MQNYCVAPFSVIAKPVRRLVVAIPKITQGRAGACPRRPFCVIANVGTGVPDGPFDEENNPRTAKSFFVPKDEIVENGYDLSINKYKKTEYKPVEYPSTTEILADLHELEMQITAGLAELEGML